MEVVERMLAQAVEDARAAVTELRNRIDVLQLKRSDLIASLDGFADDTRQGKIPDSQRVSVISTELSHVDRELSSVTRDLKSAESSLDQAVLNERRREFETYLDNARGAKAEFVRLFRECCLTLGTFAVSTQRATELSNEIGCQGKIPKLWQRLNPYDSWPGIIEHRGWGYDLRFAVSPMKQELTSQQEAGRCNGKLSR